MKLYHSTMAPNPDRVVYFLRAKDRLDTVELIDISIMKGEHKSAGFRKISPYAQLPALVLGDGTILTESRAICTYFEGIYPAPNLMGRDPKEKAIIEMWDRRIELMWFMPYATWFRNSHPYMAELEKPQLPDAAAKGEAQVKAFAKRINAHLAENEYIAADRFSIADITLFIVCGFSKIMQWAPHEEHENIGRWYKIMQAHGFAG